MLIDLTELPKSEPGELLLTPRSWDEVSLMLFDRDHNIWPHFLERGSSLTDEDRKLVGYYLLVFLICAQMSNYPAR